MKSRIRNVVSTGLLLASVLAFVTSCNFSPSASTPTAGSTAGSSANPPSGAPGIPVTHADLPGEPPAVLSFIHDASDAALASQHRVNSGENFAFDLFERPFDQGMTTYSPSLDLVQAGLSHDTTWMYITLTLVGPDPKAGGFPGVYGVEIDVNQDGRGDYLVVASGPTSTSWSSDGVKVLQDANHDIGGVHALEADTPPQKSDGYETVLVNQGQGTDPDLAYARLSPKDPNSLQLAFKWSLVDNGPFIWGAWSFDPGMFHPDWFDYNDHFTQSDAGSPVQELKQYYPLKDLYLIDNTCRWGSGFTPKPGIPGVCPVPPTPTPQPHAPGGTPVPTPTFTLAPPK